MYAHTSNVLVTKASKLIGVMVVESKDQLITIDSDYLMKVWSLETGKQLNTMLLKKQTQSEEKNYQAKKITCASLDPKEKFLAVSDDEGLITIHNINSGGTIHTLQKIGSELS